MRQVEQVVGDQLIVALHQQVALEHAPQAVVFEIGKMGDQLGIGSLGIAGPNPYEAVPLEQRERPNARRGQGLAGIVRIGDASARAIEHQPVIATLDVVPHQHPVG